MLRLLVLYTALAAGANTALAGPLDIPAAQEAGLEKLTASDSAGLPETAFTELDGTEHYLADYKGKAVLLNFWATWCAPCREEMPALNTLQTEYGDDAFQVVTIATGRNSETAIRKFYDEAGVDALPILLDKRQALAREFGVVAMPATILIDAEGHEVARLMGPAEWDSPAARKVIEDLKAP